MYGLIVKFITSPGNRDAFIQALGTGFQGMEGCHSYILAEDPSDENGVWVTEIWESNDHHAAAMAKPGIAAIIADAKMRKLHVGREMRVVTKPIIGQGLFEGDGAWRPDGVEQAR